MTDTNGDSRAEELKRELFGMQEQRKKIEDEIIMHKVVLENNKVGMRDTLTDKDDFPRDDINVYAVRHARSNIIKLENDAKNLLNQMQTKLEELHSITKPSS